MDIGIQVNAFDCKAATKATLGRSRLLGPQVDFKLISTWLNTRTRKHRSLCRPVEHDFEGSAILLRVIDVEEACLVELPNKADYATLSYVWGGVQQFRLLRENMQALT